MLIRPHADYVPSLLAGLCALAMLCLMGLTLFGTAYAIGEVVRMVVR